MKYKVGDYVIVSSRLLTINYTNSYMDAPTREMKELIGKLAQVTKVSGSEYEINILPGMFWMENELDQGVINKGNFTKVEEV